METLRDSPIVLLCNPRAGGRWRALAEILDTEDARHVRRIVTDSIDDIGPALSDLGSNTRLLCVYGGDGTIQRILQRLTAQRRESDLQLAFIGGGTMNVVSRWCGFTDSPGKNFRHVIRSYASGQLLHKEVPLLEVSQGERVRRGFTFGVGPVVRLLDEFERGSKHKGGAIWLGLKSVATVLRKPPSEHGPLLEELEAEVIVDGAAVPYRRFAALFCNVTGSLNPGVQPFVKVRARDELYYLAYAPSPKEFVLLLPLLIRGYLPMAPRSLLTPVSTWAQVARSLLGKRDFPADPRYVNGTAREVEVRSSDPIYTVDGEILRSDGSPIRVKLGPEVKLAVAPTVALGAALRLAAGVIKRRP